MSAVHKTVFFSCILGLLAMNQADGSGNEASNSNLPNLQGLPGNFPGFPNKFPGVPVEFPGMPVKFPGMRGGFENMSPEVAEDVMKLMTDPCTQKTLVSLAKLSSDLRAAKEKKDSEKKE